MKIVLRLFLLVVMVASIAQPAHAHVGNKDVYQQVEIGPYKLFITIRTPTVLPGVATVEVRSGGATIRAISMTPLLLTGEASLHPPMPDAMTRSADDTQFFTGSLWLMGSDSWQVRFGIDGDAGPQDTSVPVPAASLAVLPMQRSMGWLLSGLGLILILGVVSIAGAAVRESRLEPGDEPNAVLRHRAWISSGVALVVTVALVYFGGVWWNVEAHGYSAKLYRASSLHATLQENLLELDLSTGSVKASADSTSIKNSMLLPDHGHLMHLYAIREPQMDVAFHLHPKPAGVSGLSEELPSMPAGTYRLYADIVRVNGFPETATTELTIPAGMAGVPLSAEDASAMPPPLSAGDLGISYALPDGYKMIWDKPAKLTANAAYALRFRLVDQRGMPARDMQLYLGMAGHAAFVKADGSTFAHTHPSGSAAMPAMMLADESMMPNMDMSSASMMSGPLSPTVEFPYGFPSSGRYRVFVQMKHGDVVETGVFDTEVQP
jgi:hypothetical protein